MKILADGGRLEAYPERIYAENANAVTFIVAAATSYRGNDHRASVERALSAASRDAVRKTEIGSRRRSSEAVSPRRAAAGSPADHAGVDCRPTSGSSASSRVRRISASKRSTFSSAAIC